MQITSFLAFQIRTGVVDSLFKTTDLRRVAYFKTKMTDRPNMVSISAADGLSQQKSIQKKTRNTTKIFGLGDAISIVDARNYRISSPNLSTSHSLLHVHSRTSDQ